jgi:hypothetical protein
MHVAPIAFVAVLLLVLIYPIGSQAQEPRRDRLGGILNAEPVAQQLEKYGYPRATFLSYKDTDVTSATFGVELCVLEVPRGSARLRVKDLRVDKNPAEIFQSAISPASLGVVTGGFFGLDKHGGPIPLGLVKSEGRSIAPKHPWSSGGVVAASKDEVKILPIAKFSRPQDYSDVVQSKPMLVEAGKDGIRTAMNDRFDRSAVAIDSGGNVYFFVVHEPGGSAASLAEFSYLIRSFRSTNGKSIDFALAMDGGPGAHMYVPALKKHCGAGSPTFVPNALYFTK